MSIKGPFHFDLDCWNIDQRAFLLWSGLLKCQSKGFSTLILLLPAKSQNLGLDFKWWRLCGPTIFFFFFFEMCDFHLFDSNFFILIKKTLIFVVPWKRFYFWNLKLGIGNWKFWIWNFENWNFGILRLEILGWNLELEIWDFEILQLEILKIATSDFENLIFWKLEF